MATYFVTGSQTNNLGSIITQVGVTTRSDIVDVKPSHSNLKADNNQSVIGTSATTIRQNSSGAVTGISNIDGYVAIDIGGAPVVGETLSVIGADYPFNGVYKITSASGDTALTSSPYVSCTGISNYGTYSVNDGVFVAEDQGQFIIMTNTTEIAGQTNTAIQCNKSNGSNSLHVFNLYRSRVYANCWECFGSSGSVSPCDVTTTDVTFAEDEAASGDPTVLLSIGLKVQAADLTNPDTVGLRDPA